MIAPRFGFYFRVGIRRLGEIGVRRGIDKNYPQARTATLPPLVKSIGWQWETADEMSTSVKPAMDVRQIALSPLGNDVAKLLNHSLFKSVGGILD